MPPIFLLGPSGALIGPSGAWSGSGLGLADPLGLGIGRANPDPDPDPDPNPNPNLEDIVIGDRLVQVAREAVARGHAHGVLLARWEARVEDGSALLVRARVRVTGRGRVEG